MSGKRNIYLFYDKNDRIMLQGMRIFPERLEIEFFIENKNEENKLNVYASEIKINNDNYPDDTVPAVLKNNNEGRITLYTGYADDNEGEYEGFYFIEMLVNVNDDNGTVRISKLIRFDADTNKRVYSRISYGGAYTSYPEIRAMNYEDKEFARAYINDTKNDFYSDRGKEMQDYIAVKNNVQEFRNKNVFASADSLKEHMDYLMSLTGLGSVKDEIVSMINLVRIRELRKERGLPIIPMSLHLVFTGSPGTGKTTVARLLAQIYKEIGVLERGHLIETDRSGLVSRYIGGTAQKVRHVVDQALGGILFIDEAYALCDGQDSNDFGREAIATLLKLMEDNRDNLIVIVAGYPEKMEKFLSSNPGFMSRFNKFIKFEDYTADELSEIFSGMCAEYGYVIHNDAKDAVKKHYKDRLNTSDPMFGNGRDVRNLFERGVANQANRLVNKREISDDDLRELIISDIFTSDTGLYAEGMSGEKHEGFKNKSARERAVISRAG